MPRELEWTPSSSDAPTPPRERTVVEGNIVEHPIWKLSIRQARPKRLMVDMVTGKVLVDPETLKPREYVDPEDYTQQLDLGPDPTDAQKRRQLVIKADVHAGFPTVHALRVLIVVAEKAHFLGYANQKVPITPAEITRGLGTKEPSGPHYTAIYNSLDALEGVQLVYVDSYYDVRARAVHPGRRTERLVKKTVFKLRPRRRPTARAVVDDSAAAGAGPDDYVELGDGLWESLTSGYRFAVDRTYLNALDTDLAQRLYSYLAKKDYRSRFYEESVIKVGRRLGLAKRSPSDIRSSLEPACEILKRPNGTERKAFLRSYAFAGTRSAMKLVIETNREVDADRETAAAAVRGREVIEEFARRLRA
jgi:hypothetical protein